MISAVGGIFIRMVWPNGGADCHFLLCEIYTPGNQNLFRICQSLYGVPTVHPPTLNLSANRMRHAA